MRIVNPVFATVAGGTPATVASASPAASQESGADWRTAPMLIFGNNKPNAKELLQGIADRLSEIRSGAPIDYLFKPSPSQGAPAAMLDGIAAKYKVALLALGD